MLVGDGLAQVADSEASAPKVRVAAVGGEATGAPDRSGVSGADGSIDLRLLLAQSAPAAAHSRDDIVLVSFPISTPRSVEDDVVKEHRLEVVGRWELFGLRVVQLRVPPGRSVAALLTDLGLDQRVKSAQTSGIYRPATPGGQAKVGPGGGAKAKSEEASQASASAPRRTTYGITAALDPGSQAKASPGGRTLGGRTLGGRTHKPGVPFASASAPPALQWLTADEPFIGADGRLR